MVYLNKYKTHIQGVYEIGEDIWAVYKNKETFLSTLTF